MDKYFRHIRRYFVGLVFLVLAGWGVMEMIYSELPAGLRLIAAGSFGVLGLAGLILPRGSGWRAGCFISVFVLVPACWLAQSPSNDRDWQPDVAKLPYAGVSGGSVTIHNIRDCDYRTEDDYTVRHYDRTFELGSLRSMDLFLVDWGAPQIAHTMLSFGFGGDKYVCFSIETRRTKGERYSSVGGFFRQYELTYIVADERDVVLLRANYRKGEDVYLYRLNAPPELIRKVFMDYLVSVNRLRERPEWYNALTANCTTAVWKHIAPYYRGAKFDWRILASGHVDEMAYDLGVTDRTLPFRELRRRSRINERSRGAGRDRSFSAIIRRGLPGF